MTLAEDCYLFTAQFPEQERYGLVVQIRKAAVSIPSNVAEGHSRRSIAAYLHHVSIALGSSGELETQIELSQRLRFLSGADSQRISARCTSVGKMLTRLHQSLQARRATGQAGGR
jgi:four helix bundle protein